MSGGTPVLRVRIAKGWDKALTQYQELRRTKGVRKGIIVAELADGSYQVLGQGAKPDELPGLLLVAADALGHVEAQRTAITPEPHQEPVRRGEHNRAKPLPKAITRADDGTLVPPPGENFVSCGECHHPRWYVLHHDDGATPARIACAHCGNEVVSIRLDHAEGHA